MDKPVLVNGAPGYEGGRLAPQLLKVGWRCGLCTGYPLVEPAQGDVPDYGSLERAAAGCGSVKIWPRRRKP